MIRVLSIPGRTHENPFFRLVGDALEAEGLCPVMTSAGNAMRFRYDVLHLNFPTHYITENGWLKALATSVVLGSYLLLARLLGRKIIYTVHDVVPFRSRHHALSQAFLRLTHKLTSTFVFLSMSSRTEFARIYPADRDTPWILTRHGPYPVKRLSDDERRRLRVELAGSDDAVLVGFLGAIKPYKNFAALGELPERLPDGRPVHIVVAGQVERGYEAETAAVIARRPPGSVIRRDERLSDGVLNDLIQAVDFVLLPYLKGSNSGIALLVLSNGGRVLGSDMPIFRELAADVGPPWAYSVAPLAAGGPGLATVLQQAVADPVDDAARERLRLYLEAVSFRKAAHQVRALCERLVWSNR